MKRLSIAIALLAAMGLVLGAVCVRAKPGTGTLKGRVTNSANGVPIRDLTIEVTGHGETRTDSDGKYVFEDLPPGPCKVMIKSSQFDPHKRTITIREGKTTVSNFSALPLTVPRH